VKCYSIYFYGLCLTILFNGCEMTGSSVTSMDLSSFPLATGNKWKYAISGSDYYSDSTAYIKDTVEVTILKNKKISSENLKSILIFQFIGHTDTLTVTSIDKSLRFVFPYNGPDSAPTILRFPLTVGKRWANNNHDSYSVVSVDTLFLNGNNFSESYHIIEKYWQPNENHNIEYWIQPYIGIIKATEIGDITVASPSNWKRTWKLLSYKVNR